MNRVTSDVCDLLKLMPDSQVDEILEFIRVLRETRAGISRTGIAYYPDGKGGIVEHRYLGAQEPKG